MKRIVSRPRNDWQKTVESQGLTFHSRNVPYWNEEAAYEFTSKEIDTLEQAANEVHEIFLEAAQYVVDKDLFAKLAIPEYNAELIKKSWNNDELHLYGRFDFAYDGINPPKMLEYNADTPTSLLEASVIQWFWMKDMNHKDQFNSIHEKLIDRWKELNIDRRIHFTTMEGMEEDIMTTEYLRDTAAQAGYKTTYINLEDIGFNGTHLIDIDENRISNLFKLHPWEWLVDSEYGQEFLPSDKSYGINARIIEPAWKMLWSNKGILPIIHQIAPNHPNILKAEYYPLIEPYVKKPIYSREGANVEIIDGLNTLDSTKGEYGEEGYIYQKYHPLPNFDGKRPVLGLWMIGDYSCGMGIRESEGLITSNTSRFVPHYFF